MVRYATVPDTSEAARLTPRARRADHTAAKDKARSSTLRRASIEDAKAAPSR